MKLYYSPGACSLSPHIILKELGESAELIKVDLRKHALADGADFYQVNPQGYVPLLELDDGTRLSEGPAIIQYLADLKPELGLAPPNGTIARYQLQQMLNFLTTEIHKGYYGVFYAGIAGKYGEQSQHKLEQRFAWIDQQLASRPYLTGDSFTVADAYLFALVGWGKASWLKTYIDSGFSLEGLAHLRTWYERMRQRAAILAALAEEGLE